ncbi:MAG: hypothetical protein J0M19_05975 [Sphingomonadales bacterium]|nr:hypothetical protein [Sphingomonadales bacterium]
MTARWNRRDFLYGGAALSAALAGPDLRGILGAKLPEPVRALVPGDALQVAGLIGELLKLEQEAKALRLPPSPLDFHLGQAAIVPDQLYQIAMPRLVALIDRAERPAPILAEKAGGLLAKLHRSEYDPPDAWFAGGGSAPAAGLSFPSPQRPDRQAITADPDNEPPLSSAGPFDLPAGNLPQVEEILPPVATTLKFEALADEYAAWFAAARIRPEFSESTQWHLTMMMQSRSRYERLGKQLGIPWFFIAATHGLEASFNFRAHMHNGDFPLTQRTRQVPAGRPSVWLPPSSWEASAADAMRLLGLTGQSDWSLPRCLYRLEAYNGFGYRRAGRASPYLWSFSTLYSRGKYVADGKFDPNARSKQCGAAVMLKLLDMAGALG